MAPILRLSLLDVTVLITTFERPAYLNACLDKLRKNFPECDIAIACDDDKTSSTPRYQEMWVRLPYDTGLTAKRNAAVNLVTTKYALLGCDDFDFNKDAYHGVVKMAEILDACPDIDVVVGTYNGARYEGTIEYVPGSHIRTKRIGYDVEAVNAPHPAYKIDIGTNYFLARTSVLREVRWDEDIYPIGGEHCDWFLALKEAGKNVVWTPCAKINPFFIEGLDLAGYRALRRRASIGHRQFMVKRNIAKFYGFDE